MYEILSKYQIQNSSRIKLVRVGGSGANYTSIKDAVNDVSPTALNPVIIYVRNGIYNEIQITGKDYLTIIGESVDGVIMISDGTRTDIDPISGLRYADMPKDDKHGFLIQNIMSIRNMTIRVNDVKYCIHMDSGIGWYRTFENCLFQHADGFPVGIGSWSGQKMIFNNCQFEKLGAMVATGVSGSHGLFWHNWNEQTNATFLNMCDCLSVNAGFISMLELGSEKTDLCKFKNCISGDPLRDIHFDVTNVYYDGGGHLLTDIPYSVNILTLDESMLLDYSIIDRPNLLDHVSQE